jgi:hypothetical protein
MTFGLFLHVDYFFKKDIYQEGPFAATLSLSGCALQIKISSSWNILTNRKPKTYSAAGKPRTEASSEKWIPDQRPQRVTTTWVPWLLRQDISLEVIYIRSEFNLADAGRRRCCNRLHKPSWLTQSMSSWMPKSTSTLCSMLHCCQTTLHEGSTVSNNGLNGASCLYVSPSWNLLPQVLQTAEDDNIPGKRGHHS